MDTDTDNSKPIGHLNNPSGEIVKVARELVDKWRNDTTAAELRAEELRKELELERAKTADERLDAVVGLIESLKEIADHHCANLSPEFIRDMPAGSFATAAVLVDKVAGATQRDSERAAVWAERARIINDWRDRRGTPEWAEHVAEYKEKQLREQAHAAGYTILPLHKGSALQAVRDYVAASGYKLVKKTKTKVKAKAKPAKRKVTKRR